MIIGFIVTAAVSIILTSLLPLAPSHPVHPIVPFFFVFCSVSMLVLALRIPTY